MALLTALDIARRAADELNLDRPASLPSGTAETDRQLFALLNRTGRQLMREHAWSALQTLATITTVASQDTYDLPEDYARQIDDTSFNRADNWRVIGPISPQQDRLLRDGVQIIGIGYRFRIKGRQISIYPVPTASGQVLAFEYISAYWARSAAGVPKDEFTLDTDKSVFDPDLMVTGLKWRFMAAKGMGTAEGMLGEFMADRDVLIAADLGGTTINMSGMDCRDAEGAAGDMPDFILSDGGDALIVD